MSEQSGNRFGARASYYNQSQNLNPTETSKTSTFIAQTQAIKSPALLSYQHSRGYEPPKDLQGQPSLDFLLAYYKPEERVRIKNENVQKYKMNPESMVYKFPPSFLESLVYKYPSQFSPQMQEQLTSNMGKLRREYGIYHKLLMGSFLYWFILRRMQWFKLTGNAVSRVTCFALSFSHMGQAVLKEGSYMVQNAFIYNEMYEQVIRNHNIDPAQATRAQTIS